MAANPLRTTLNRASAERCLRSLGATSAMATPTGRPQIVSVRDVLLHRCLRKDNPESPVFPGFYTSPGIAVAVLSQQGFLLLAMPGDDVIAEPHQQQRST